jgi:hypothetical protein
VHIGNLNLSDSQLNSLQFCIRRIGFERCFLDYPRPIHSFVVSVSAEGYCWFPASVDGISGHFVDPDGNISFTVVSNYSFIEIVTF